MLLTAEQLQEIRQIILDHHNAFAVSQYGFEAVSPEILAALKAKGLVEVDLSTLQDAFVYGKVVSILGQAKADSMSYPQFKAYVRANPVPLTPAEQHAVTVATQQAGALCQGLGNKYDKATGQILIEADAELRRNFEATIRDKTAENIARRKSIKNLKSDFGHATGDWTRDLNRIAVTETQSAMQAGLASAIAEKNGPEALVAKRVAPNCCDICVKLYTGSDGAPRIFELSKLQAMGTNFGRKAGEARPVVGPVHPNCCPPGTLVTTAVGLKPIEYIIPGDLVWTHKRRFRRVTHVWEQEHQGKLIEIQAGWASVRATANHLFYDGKTWNPAGSLVEGEELVRDTAQPEISGQPSKPVSCAQSVSVLHGQGPDAPFLALLTPDSVFIHEGYIYHRDRIADGPVVPALSGRLRFTRSSALSISGGDSLRLTNPEWLDDSMQPLVFVRCGVDMTYELRSRCATGPFACLHKDWSKPIAAHAKGLSENKETLALDEMKPEQLLRVEGDLAGSAAVRAARAGSGGNRQGAAYYLPADPQQSGYRCDAHALVVEQPGHSLRVHVQPVRSPRHQAGSAKGAGHILPPESEVGCYRIEGLVIVEMSARDGVYIDIAPRRATSDVGLTHFSDVAERRVISKVSSKPSKGMVYNLTVEDDESYVADGFVAHNCRCQMVAVPPGGGFNGKNQMSMKGKKGILTDPATLEEQMAHKSMMAKAMDVGMCEVFALGLSIDIKAYAPAHQQGAWLAKGHVAYRGPAVAALLGDVGTSEEVYIIHGSEGPDAAALGFERPLDAALAYQTACRSCSIASMDAVSLKAFAAHLDDEESKALGPKKTKASERLVLSQSPKDQGFSIARDDVQARVPGTSSDTGLGGGGINLVMNVPKAAGRPARPKTRQDIGGVTEAYKHPEMFEQSRPIRFDKEANDIYRNTPEMPKRKLDVEASVLPQDDLKLIIKRNKRDLKRKEEQAAAEMKAVQVGAQNTAAYFSIGIDAAKPAAPAIEAELLAPAKKREPVK